MFADPPLFIRLLRRPCPNRDDCFNEWAWADNDGNSGVRVTCKTCGGQFVSKDSCARLVFVDNDAEDDASPQAHVGKIKELTDENEALREQLEAKEAETEKLQGTGGRTGYKMLIEPLK